MDRPRRAPSQDRALHALVHRLLFETAFAIAWKRLAGFGLSDADREDVIQNALLVAFLKRDRYRTARGTLEAWISGIVRCEALELLRRQGKRVPLSPDDVPSELAGEGPTPEEHVSLSELADQVFERLPPEERRVVILREVRGLSFRAIAALEGISPSTALARHTRGMAKIRQMAEEQARSGIVALPAAFADAGGDDGPPPEVRERLWRRLAPLLDLDAPPESEPPPSGTRRALPDAPRRGSVWLRRVGPIVAALFGGFASGPVLDRCGDHPSEERSAVAAALAVAPEPPAPAVVVTAEVQRAPARDPAPRPVARPAGPRPDPELLILDHARQALGSGNLPAALATLAEHERLFPGEQSSARRREVWAKVCAYSRSAGVQTSASELAARCAGRP
jgi:RNA polymerase sigma factor (sigma-70 family)